jgi:hypothetical protein
MIECVTSGSPRRLATAQPANSEYSRMISCAPASSANRVSSATVAAVGTCGKPKKSSRPIVRSYTRSPGLSSQSGGNAFASNPNPWRLEANRAEVANLTL